MADILWEDKNEDLMEPVVSGSGSGLVVLCLLTGVIAFILTVLLVSYATDFMTSWTPDLSMPAGQPVSRQLPG